MSSKPSSTAGTTASATNSRSSIGTGFSPRIHPRPKYPSLGYISWQFVNQLVFHCCGMGALLLPLLAPLYFQTRELAHEYQVSNKLYFTLMLSGVHTGVCLADNSRKSCNTTVIVRFQTIQSYQLILSFFDCLFAISQHILSVILGSAFNRPNSTGKPTWSPSENH